MFVDKYKCCFLKNYFNLIYSNEKCVFENYYVTISKYGFLNMRIEGIKKSSGITYFPMFSFF